MLVYVVCTTSNYTFQCVVTFEGCDLIPHLRDLPFPANAVLKVKRHETYVYAVEMISSNIHFISHKTNEPIDEVYVLEVDDQVSSKYPNIRISINLIGGEGPQDDIAPPRLFVDRPEPGGRGRGRGQKQETTVSLSTMTSTRTYYG